MFRRIASIATLILCSLLTEGVLAEPLLLVVNRTEGTVSYVDPSTYEVLETVRVGEGPHEIAATADGKLAFITGYEGYENAVYVLDIPGRKKLDIIELSPNYSPHGIDVTSDGTKLYTTCERSRTVAEVDIPSRSVTRRFRITEPVPHMLVLSPDDKTVYVTNLRGNNISVIDLEAGKIERYIRAGAGCEGIDIKPDGSEVWTANRTQETVSVIDTREKKNVRTLEARGYPIRVRFSPDGKLALVSCGKRGIVDVFDTSTYESVGRVRTTLAPSGILFTPDGKRAFVAHVLDHRVSVIDMEKLEVVEVLDLGPSPDGMAWVE